MGQVDVAEFKSTMRSKTHAVLVRETGAEAINLFNLSSDHIEGRVMQTTTNNDFIFSQVGSQVHVTDLSTGQQSPAFTVEPGCIVQRTRENEAAIIVSHTEATLGVQCDG